MRNPTEYLKMRVLGAIDMAPGRTLRERVRAVSEMTFTDEDGNPRSFTWRTIETWLMRFNKHGVTALATTPRSDRGHTRKVSLEEVQEAIEAVMPLFHNKTPTRTAIYRAAIEKELLHPSRIAPNTFRRIVKEHDMLTAQADSPNKRRQAFAKAHANQMWQADTMFGPHVKHGSRHVRSKLIAFIDDASRLCVHGAFHAAENVDTLVESLRSAFYKRGLPESLYVDNGSIYTSREIVQICSRVGCILTHAPVRDGAAKGKVERFFRRVREQFLCREQDLSSLDALNRSFNHWVEEHYNATRHSVIGMAPVDRFALDRRRVRYLPPGDANDELFFVEEDRVVRADNTFMFQGARYEAPRHLTGRKVQVRFRRSNPFERVIVYFKAERMGQARPVDYIANDRPPSSKKTTATVPAQTTPAQKGTQS